MRGGDPSGTLLPGVDPNERKVKFNLLGFGDTDPLNQRWHGQPIWIMSHGWNSNANNFANLAKTVRNTLGNSGLVLTLDWSEAANTGSHFFTQNNNKAASWILSIADFRSGIDKIVLDKTTFSSLTTAAGNILSSSEFASINSATNDLSLVGASAARMVSNAATSDLFFNTNASAVGVRTGGLFAKLPDIAAPSASDFLVRA